MKAIKLVIVSLIGGEEIYILTKKMWSNFDGKMVC